MKSSHPQSQWVCTVGNWCRAKKQQICNQENVPITANRNYFNEIKIFFKLRKKLSLNFWTALTTNSTPNPLPRGWVDRASATETVNSGSTPGRVEWKTIKIRICSFPAWLSATKKSVCLLRSLHCVLDRWAGGSLTQRPKWQCCKRADKYMLEPGPNPTT